VDRFYKFIYRYRETHELLRTRMRLHGGPRAYLATANAKIWRQDPVPSIRELSINTLIVGSGDTQAHLQEGAASIIAGERGNPSSTAAVLLSAPSQQSVDQQRNINSSIGCSDAAVETLKGFLSSSPLPRDEKIHSTRSAENDRQ
jgi:hypothetical protein